MNALHVIYRGVVQGVGFRFTVRRLATALELTGWVRNNMDGSVELMATGDPATLNRLCDHIEGHFKGNITDTERKEINTDEQFENFEITY